MKIRKLLFLASAIMVVGLFSCSKESDSASPASQEAVVKYTYNGSTYTLKGSLSGAATTGAVIGKEDVSSSVIALLFRDSTSKPMSKYTGIPIIKSTSNLTSTGTYTVSDYTVEFGLNGSVYYATNSYSITITSLSNGVASGTFALNNFKKFSGSGPATATVTGEFSNVKVQ